MRIGHLLYKYRVLEDLTLRDLALELGISIPTLHRIESGKKMDGDTLAKILTWLVQEIPVRERRVYEPTGTLQTQMVEQLVEVNPL